MRAPLNSPEEKEMIRERLVKMREKEPYISTSELTYRVAEEMTCLVPGGIHHPDNRKNFDLFFKNRGKVNRVAVRTNEFTRKEHNPHLTVARYFWFKLVRNAQNMDQNSIQKLNKAIEYLEDQIKKWKEER